MKLLQLRYLFNSELNHIYTKNEINYFLNILTKHKLKLTRVDIAIAPNLKATKKELFFFKTAIKKLKKEIPIQYIIGKTEFCGLSFHVNKNVLIPRPETEELVHKIIEDTKDKKNLQILDIGTGSGCIAISLAKNVKNAKVSALDFSKTAIDTAKKNAQLNNIKIDFLHQNILQTEKLQQQFDIIVSNPPYVLESQKKEMRNNVLENEPNSALFVNDDNPLIFYDKIADLSLSYLKPNGTLYFEINQYLGKETIKMLQKKGFSKNELQKDVFKNDRIIKSCFL